MMHLRSIPALSKPQTSAFALLLLLLLLLLPPPSATVTITCSWGRKTCHMSHLMSVSHVTPPVCVSCNDNEQYRNRAIEWKTVKGFLGPLPVCMVLMLVQSSLALFVSVCVNSPEDSKLFVTLLWGRIFCTVRSAASSSACFCNCCFSAVRTRFRVRTTRHF